MGALLSHLEEMLAEGRSKLELVRAVEDELTGSDLLDEELAESPRVITQAEEHARLFDGVTLSDAQRGGLYVPEELAELAVSRGDPEWHARESLRFSCFAILLRPLQERARIDGQSHEDYSSTVTELAQQLARIRIHTSRAP